MNPLTLHLKAILGEEGFVLFAEAFGGTRAYIPYHFGDDHEVVQLLGRAAADKLSREMAPSQIRVPLGRRERALYWRAKGLSDSKVARKLGMTEKGVAKLFGREPDLPDRPGRSKNTGQLSLF